MPDKVLRTKLAVPASRPNFLSRPHLLDKLEQGLQAACTLTLVSAPAGFGKTSLVADWGRRMAQIAPDGRTVCWLSLDPYDNDPNRFWQYVVAELPQAVNGLITDFLPSRERWAASSNRQ